MIFPVASAVAITVLLIIVANLSLLREGKRKKREKGRWEGRKEG